MPRKEPFSGTPREWLKRARGNLARARQAKPKDAYWEDLCFDAQQAAEKAVKAVLVVRGVEFPKTHDIRTLLTLLDPAGSVLPADIWKAIELSAYAVAARYPGGGEPVTEEEYREAVEQAGKIVRWAEKLVAARGDTAE